ncbi:hypothetical protein PVAND_003122 [Polypedilum vanderplanki]|uniref:Bestrophin homolog n=1 Tax=Polypedilum vanderplanki TaxID=319348 RepID=A0A9J6BTZ7_POLVA|nr:hypothetical protein PVAND_003122 [Polypedilum vanderplanki]
MTVSYSDSVTTTNPWTFLKLLIRWKGSVYKLLWRELLFYLALFYAIHFIYIYLPKDHQANFESFVKYTKLYQNIIPISFVLGFFVNTVMTRWWNHFEAIPYPLSIAIHISCKLQGYDEVGRAMRRTIMRYVCLSLTLVFRRLSTRVQLRFPKFKDLVIAGLMFDSEVQIIEDVEAKYPGYSKNWLPITWAANIVAKARNEGRIDDDVTVNEIIHELNAFRQKLTVLLYYNTITIPLVYTQVVTASLYIYFLAALFSHQHIQSDTSYNIGSFNLDIHPILLILQFIFHIGWLKVGQALVNPFGMDDDDFDVNSMIDRNLQSSYIIVDNMHNSYPDILKDRYWNELPKYLPDRAKTVFQINSPKAVNDADVVDYTEPRPTTWNDLEKSNASYAVIRVNAPINLVPDSGVIAHVYKNIDNVEHEQLLINRAMQRKSQNRDSNLSEESEESIRESK